MDENQKPKPEKCSDEELMSSVFALVHVAVAVRIASRGKKMDGGSR